MGILANLTEEIKQAMLEKDSVRLEALRAIKSAVMLAQTASGGGDTLKEEEEIKLIQKLVKQRKDSATIFREQNRIDLAEPEEAQAKIISAFLPKQLSSDEISLIVDRIIEETAAQGMQDMGKVMGLASKEMAGKADGKSISTIVKGRLSS